MGIHRGSNITRSGLAFAYDTGYSPSFNGNSRSIYNQGQPTTNTILSGAAWHGDGGNQSVGNIGYTVITDESLKYSGYETVLWTPGSSRNVYFNGNDDISTSDNSTVWTFSCYMRYESPEVITAMQVYLYYPSSDGSAGGTITDCGNGWYRVSRTRTGSSAAIALAGFTGFTANKKIYLSGPTLTKTNTVVPYVNRAATRSTSGSLLDITKQSSIDLTNVSFDSSAHMTFDGTNDFIDITTNFGTVSQYTFEWVENPGQTHKMPIANRTNTEFYKYGAYSWRYKHGGTIGEFYHTAGATSGWHHWAITYDGTTLKVFQDNISLGTRAVTGTADFSDGFKVGWWSAGGAYAFNGDIPIMRIYSKALTTQEVAQNFSAYRDRFNI